jgi:hypothetical protein
VFKSQRTILDETQRSLRVREQELAGLRTANEELRTQLEQAIERACEAEERVSVLTRPLPREYD